MAGENRKEGSLHHALCAKLAREGEERGEGRRLVEKVLPGFEEN